MPENLECVLTRSRTLLGEKIVWWPEVHLLCMHAMQLAYVGHPITMIESDAP